MTPFLTDAELAELGCPGARVHPPDALPLGTRPQGLSGATAFADELSALVASTAERARMVRVEVPSAERLGLTLRAHPVQRRFVEVVSDRGTPLDVSGEGTQRGESRDAAYVDLAVPGVAAVCTTSGALLAFRRAGRDAPSASVAAVEPAVPRWEPLASVEPPLREWRHACGDPWLRDRLVALDRDAWNRTVAAGLVALYADAVLAARARAWARGLVATQRSTIEDLGVAEAARLQARLEHLDATADPGRPAWRRALRAVRLARDELEGVLVLLGEEERPERLLGAVADLDAAGRGLTEALPEPLPPDDEQLRRAADLDPDAWWSGAR